MRIALALLLFAVAGAHGQPAPAWQPTRAVEIVVPSGAGGGNDRNARGLHKIMHENKWLQNVTVLNKVGGGGTLANTYVNSHPGDGHYLVFARQGLLSNHLLGRSTIGPNDLTTLAMLTSEPSGLALRANNPTLKSLQDVIERLKQDPASLTTSLGSTRAGSPHLMLGMFAKVAGIDARRMKTVTFSGGAESMTQLMGGHIDMSAVSIDNAAPHHKSGALRIIGVSSAQRLAPLPDVPTFKEQGYDVQMSGFTIVMGPRGLSAAQTAYWESMMERISNTAEWKRILAADLQDWDFRKAAPTREYLRQQYEMTRGLLADIGMTK